jgi:acyl carrier protein
MTEAETSDPETEVKRILIQTLRLNLSPEDLSGDTRLLDGDLGLDSLAGLRIVMAIEQHFGFMFDVSDLTRESFQSVGSLVALVGGKLQSDGGAGT